MWMMLQQQNPDDFVLASGETHPVREFVEKAFECVNIKLKYDLLLRTSRVIADVFIVKVVGQR